MVLYIYINIKKRHYLRCEDTSRSNLCVDLFDHLRGTHDERGSSVGDRLASSSAITERLVAELEVVDTEFPITRSLVYSHVNEWTIATFSIITCLLIHSFVIYLYLY